MSANSSFEYAAFFEKKAVTAAKEVQKSAAEYERRPGMEAAVRLKMDIDQWIYYEAARRATECHGL
jgi:hypothetical protein